MKHPILLSALVFSWGVSLAQTEPAAPVAQETAGLTGPSAWEDRDGDYRLGSGDVIEISVFGVEQFRYTVRLGSAGTITLPFVGAVPASGATLPELTERLTELLGDKLFQDPQVNVVVKEHHSSPIILMGAVANPGTYQKVDPSTRLIDLLAEAGGVSKDAGEYVLVQRRGPLGEDPETLKISLDELFRSGIGSLNIPLQAGDVVNVPSREREPRKVFYVIGEVGVQGEFDLPSERPLLLSQALAAAGGPLRTAKVSKGLLVRFNEQGERQQIAINYKHVLKGKQADFEVHDRDIIMIPGSNAKTIAYGLLGIIPSTAQSTASGVIP